ncbi:RNA-binding protein, putative [Entamoeba histolytica HM-1:IMSS-B]|uniref:RNA-binding protein, putative n=8 Tax=Entamoeba TaxID=5758 RepID=C4M2C5_ENTH1|nr:RNA-binding protein, putative [Entamoeba nuttalli P19]XP_650802.1 RNA-binding protein, putative [Entamoeba histolytica HM-1:IMSS]EMD48584.1 RNA-binding protein, putative [Entamoeba histolytica KU27]EMH72180.1 RNA-binding protein, putative [Entamoeba histolytica HM-1:IMSS-B]EMS14647.1 RNA-binding protein [Entamoeba histolytica HM-3:IMSS]ENY60926.1 RNA-binding protein, putative [Entamoeba histolytica HM-1:IMSS-A]GAT95427.1 RNA-binding protein putative [Entamoeba histolytica]|eukprot:XP_008856493.1 RNA-binding protein, putative [Entamoeba nuttalli P19]
MDNNNKQPKRSKKRSHNKLLPKTVQKEVMNGIRVSNIPIKYTIEQFVDYFRHCGIAKKKTPTQYDAYFSNENESNKTKEGVLYFLHEESVQKAIEYYDNSQIEPKCFIQIEGIFSQPEDSNPNEKKYDQTREDEWDDNKLVHVVIKNMFDLKKPKDEQFFNELKEDVEEEVKAKCGSVEKVTVFNTNPEGIVIIKFKDHSAAEQCVALMNGRWFDKHQLSCDYYDGYTNYKVEETEEQKRERIARWEEYLGGSDD